MATSNTLDPKTASASQLRMRNPAGFLVLGSFVCLLLGAFAGWILSSPGAQPAPTATALQGTPIGQQVLGAQKSVLIVTVDSLSAAPRPNLDGCWVLTFTPGTDKYFLVGFSQDTPVSLEPPLRLIDYYNKGQSAEDGALFINSAIYQITGGGFQPDYSLIVDRKVIAEMVNAVGGLRLGGETLPGSAVLERYALLPDNALARLEFQRASLEAFANAVRNRPWSPDALDLLYQQYQATSADANELLALGKQSLPLTNAIFEVRAFEPPRAP